MATVTALVFIGFARVSPPQPPVVVPPDSAIPLGVTKDLYSLLARGLLRGHLALDAAVPAELAQAASPYDPSARPTAHLHDASLYRGRYYLYFGPAPAVLLFLPFRAATGRDLGSPAAVALLCLLAYAGLIALFGAVAPGWWRRELASATAILITLGGASCLLPLLRRPAFYEVAIAAGSAFFLWSFVVLLRLPQSRRPIASAALAGLLLGLAVASRPTYLLCFAPLAAGIIFMRRPRQAAGRRADLAAATAALGSIMVLLGWYNFLRFGNVLEFGDRYQLSSAGALRHFSLSFVPWQLRTYFGSGLGVSRYFPFFHAIPSAAAPPGYFGNEYAFGLLRNVPILIFAGFALARTARRSAGPSREGLWLLAAAAACSLLPLLGFLGSAVRYLADFTPALAVIACVGLADAVTLAGEARPEWGRWPGRAACLFAIASSAVVALLCVDMYDRSPATPPAAFDRIGAIFDRPAVWYDWIRDVRYGPRRLAVMLPSRQEGAEPLLTAVSATGHRDALRIEYVGGESIRFAFSRDGAAPTIRSREIAANRGRPHTIVASLGALLPLRPEELLRPPAPALFAGLRTWLHLEFDGQVVWETPIEPRPERFERVRVGEGDPKRAEPTFSGRILDQSVLPASAIRLALPQWDGAAARLRLTPAMAGRTFPLMSTGRPQTGNLLLLAVGRDGKIRFGYDHWGKPTLWSPALAADLAIPHRVAFWLPSIVAPTVSSPLLVTWDDRVVWRAVVPYFPAAPNEIFPGCNPIGGSTCEPSLINARFEALDLPRPLD